MFLRWARTRPGSSWLHSPRRADSSKANAQPIATPSPCRAARNSPSPPQARGRTCGPRFSSARSPCSVSSRTTISAFISTERFTADPGAMSPGGGGWAVFFKPLKESKSPNSPYLTTSPYPARKSRGARCENLRVRQNQARLVEGTDQVLALRRVDSGLAADRTVDLRQQAGGHLHEAHPPPQHRGGESDQISDHPAAQSHDDIAPLDPLLQQPFHRALEMRPGFRRLARRKVRATDEIPFSASALTRRPDEATRHSRR